MSVNSSKPDAKNVPRRHPPLTWRKKILFAGLAILFFFGSLEISLRVLGIHFDPNEIAVLAFGEWQQPMTESIRPGMWEPLPDSEQFNEDGFVGPTIPKERTPGTLRIATMGDSCTQWGDPPYPALLQPLLEEKLQMPVEVLNAGVIRYSTEQGLRRLRERVLPYRPDVVTINFGWNDHWMNEQKSDAALLHEAIPKVARLLRPLQSSRVVQLISFFADLLHDKMQEEADKQRRWVIRVSPEDYTANLRSMVLLARQNGAVPVLVTAPTEATGMVDPWFVLLRGFRDLAYKDHVALHDAYVERTRQVARELNVPLVDARAHFQSTSGNMVKDQIHFTQLGHERLAALLAEEITGLGVENRETQESSP